MKLLMAMAAGALGYCYYAGRCAKNARAPAKPVKEELHRWEGEGGNVPAVATPSTAPVPNSSYPQPVVDPGLRH